MVMPCYDKVEYIGEMFESILAQKWDNIEVILVNDGSTDGTREVISEYESNFCNAATRLLS
jgi:glycosyltransferase involved in cell wall biosynthesis